MVKKRRKRSDAGKKRVKAPELQPVIEGIEDDVVLVDEISDEQEDLTQHGVVLPIVVPNQRLVWVRIDGGVSCICNRKPDSCRPGNKVLIKDRTVIKVLK